MRRLQSALIIIFMVLRSLVVGKRLGNELRFGDKFSFFNWNLFALQCCWVSAVQQCTSVDVLIGDQF